MGDGGPSGPMRAEMGVSLQHKFICSPALGLLLILGLLVGCNLGFDANEFEPLVTPDVGGQSDADDSEDASDEDVPEELPPGCEDNDGDGFGRGQDCPKDENDCDDTRRNVHPGAEERCDSLDNDCDGRVDEDNAGKVLTRACYSASDSHLEGEDTACRQGRQSCTDGQFVEPVTAEECVGEVLPSNEGESAEEVRCDGIDNDCDGEVDPLCPCTNIGDTRPCYAGDASLAGVGICVRGVETCIEINGGRDWGACEGSVPPQAENCLNMGSDDDCDGIDDNIPDIGQRCVSGEDGECSAGEMGCDGEDFVCVPNLVPAEEICDGLDNDCDGAIDNGVDNGCGGCVELDGVPGESCGVCDDGVYTCNGADEIVCVDATPLNACGGCGELQREPDEPCGECGEIVCDGPNTVSCDDEGFNACNGCGLVQGGEQLGQECGRCGEVVCDGQNDTRCAEELPNECGGCAELEGSRNDACGPCNDGALACAQDGESLGCVGATDLNACNGCGVLGAEIGDGCGRCGAFRCDPNNIGQLFCDDPGTNVCGGCGVLPEAPNQPCGLCGTTICQDGTTVCNDPGRNSCGGCVELPGDEGDACGECGTYACTSQDSVNCEDPGFNICGGCATLDNAPNTPCGQCGTYQCAIDPNFVVCDDPGLNACGGCGDLQGPALGQPCGVCGQYVCDGENATRCEDPGLNGCGTCDVLPEVLGSSCGECAVHYCDPENGDAFVCDNRPCLDQLAAIRLSNYLPRALGMQMVMDDSPILTLADFSYTQRTVYLRVVAGEHVIKLWDEGADTALDPPIMTKTFTLLPGEEVTGIVAGLDGIAEVDWDLRFYSADNTPVPDAIKVRWIHAFPDQGPVDVYINGELHFEGIVRDEASQYSTYTGGRITEVRIHNSGSPAPTGVFTLGTPLTVGSVYEITHRGRLSVVEFPQIINSQNTRALRYFP